VLLLAVDEFAIGVEDGDGGYTLFDGDLVLLSDVEIFVHLTDVDVSDEKRFVKRGSDLRTVEGFVEDVAVEAPVAAEDEENAFVSRSGGVEKVGDFFVGVDARGIDDPILERLAKPRGGGMLRADEAPLAVEAIPGLRHGDVLLVGLATFLGGQGELNDDDMQVGRLVGLLSDLRGNVGEALGFPGCPEGDFVGERNRALVWADDFGGRRLCVERGERGGVAGEHGGAPLVERRKGLGAGGGGKKKNRYKD